MTFALNSVLFVKLKIFLRNIEFSHKFHPSAISDSKKFDSRLILQQFGLVLSVQKQIILTFSLIMMVTRVGFIINQSKSAKNNTSRLCQQFYLITRVSYGEFFWWIYEVDWVM